MSSLTVRTLGARQREAALAFLGRDATANLFLIDLVRQVGGRIPATEVAPQVVVVWRGDEVVSVASLRPSIVVDPWVESETLAVLMPHFESIEAGLLKCRDRPASLLWERLSARGLRAIVDRREIAYVIRKPSLARRQAPDHLCLRRAEAHDLDGLVFAARASLREEGRPDPFDGDPVGFRRWVQGRLHRARVVDIEGRLGFVGYADVRRSEGWLVQGVYTWPAQRRRGCADLGMRGLIAEAIAQGADHVQLSVVEGNEPAIGLYESVGFEPFDRLRTVLFV